MISVFGTLLQEENARPIQAKNGRKVYFFP